GSGPAHGGGIRRRQSRRRRPVRLPQSESAAGVSTLLPPGSGDPIVMSSAAMTPAPASAPDGGGTEVVHSALRRFTGDPLAMTGLVFIVGVIVMAIAAPLLAP